MNTIQQRDLLHKHLGDCIDYIEQLENSIQRLDAQAVFDDMPETDLDFFTACDIFNKTKEDIKND